MDRLATLLRTLTSRKGSSVASYGRRPFPSVHLRIKDNTKKKMNLKLTSLRVQLFTQIIVDGETSIFVLNDAISCNIAFLSSHLLSKRRYDRVIVA